VGVFKLQKTNQKKVGTGGNDPTHMYSHLPLSLKKTNKRLLAIDKEKNVSAGGPRSIQRPKER